MVSDRTRLKVRTIFKTFLLLNNGRRVTSSEVCRFINGNRFALSGHKVSGSELANYWRVDHSSASGLLFDVFLAVWDNDAFCGIADASYYRSFRLAFPKV